MEATLHRLIICTSINLLVLFLFTILNIFTKFYIIIISEEEVYNMESLIYLIIIIISAITVIANKVRHVKMTQEEKELYKSGVEKLGNVDKNRKLLFCSGIVIYILIIAIYLYYVKQILVQIILFYRYLAFDKLYQ